MKPKHVYDPWRRQYDAELDGCYDGMYRGYDWDTAICRASCDALKAHRFTLRRTKH
jgi:hypothetical protein